MKAKATILVVDDDNTNLAILANLLIKWEYNVVTAYNGSQALNKLKEQRFDLILLDLIMPGLDGIQVIKMIKDDVGYCDTPIVIISANRDKDIVLESIRQGATDYLAKPFEPQIIRSRVEAILANKRVQELEALLKESEEREKRLQAEIQAIRLKYNIA